MPPNLADPSIEPTDEELERLAKDAFADVAAENEAWRARLRERILQTRAAKRGRAPR